MCVILWWFIAATLIGWLCFPLTARVFRKLPSRGYAFSRALGLLIWGIIYWQLTSWGILKNTLQSVILGILLLFSLYFGLKWGFTNIRHWLMDHWRMILGVEFVFLAAFFGFTLFRSTSPAIVGTEKPMELAFLNAILRSERFPPHDPWLSGYSISYYYFGYVLVAMLTRLTGVSSSVGFNMAQALWFGMAAASIYGLLIDLFAIWESKKSGVSYPIKKWMVRWALLAPVLLLLLGNAYGFLDVLHARGIFWQEKNGVSVSGFWGWMDLRGLDEPPLLPYQWEPQRSKGVTWWNASRVVRDTDYSGERVEIIDEFPNFSFILGDLHPHLLAMPFVLISIGLALDYFNTSKEAKSKLGKTTLPIQIERYLLASVIIGALGFLNTWDLPIYAALYAAVFLMKRIECEGWRFSHLVAFLAFGVGMALIGILFYLPFFLEFSSQAGGLLPSLIYFTKGIHFWVMFFPLLPPLGIYLFWVFKESGGKRSLLRAVLIVSGLLILLVLFNVAFSSVAIRLRSLGDLFMANQGAPQASLTQLFKTAGIRRLLSPGTWLTLCALLIMSLSVLLTINRKSDRKLNAALVFIVLLVLWGVLLVFLPEFVYLLDNSGKRTNTIFKFFYQNWILWSLTGAFGIGFFWRRATPDDSILSKLLLTCVIILTIFILVILGIAPLTGDPQSILPPFGAYLLDWLWLVWGSFVLMAGLFYVHQKQWGMLFRICVLICLGVGLVYPVGAFMTRVNHFSDPDSWTLDGSDYYCRHYPDLMAAVDWLWTVEPGVLVEAVGPDGGDFSTYGRVSMLTGLPAVLGWRFHEVQWRGGVDEIGSRQEDVALLYETLDWRTAHEIIDKYNIEYIYIGDLERTTYDLSEEKFSQNLPVVFQKGEHSIYHIERD